MLMWAASFSIAVLSICLALFEIRESCAALHWHVLQRGAADVREGAIASRRVPVPLPGTRGSRARMPCVGLCAARRCGAPVTRRSARYDKKRYFAD